MNKDTDGLFILALNVSRRMANTEVDGKDVSPVCLAYTYHLHTLCINMLCV